MSFLRVSSSLRACTSQVSRSLLPSPRCAQRRLPPLATSITRGGFHRFSTSRSALTPITRQTFINPGYEKVAATQTETMYVLEEDGQSGKSVPVPQSVKESGVVPEGYSVDFLVDPHMLVEFCKERLKLSEESEMPPGLLEELKSTVNNPHNLRMIPTFLYEAKLRMFGGAEDSSPSSIEGA